MWTYGDGQTGTSAAPTHTHTYATAGSFSPSLVATGPGGVNTFNAGAITVSAPNVVVASFTASPLSGAFPLTVTFTNSSKNATSYVWTYGDGQTGTSAAATHTHTYDSAGIFSVSLTATGPGGSNTMTRSSHITATGAAAVSANWVERSTAPAVVWSHRFDNDAEMSNFSTIPDDLFDAGQPLLRRPDPTVGHAVTFRFLGSYLTEDFLSNGVDDFAAGPRVMRLSDASDWPAGNFLFSVSRAAAWPAPEKRTAFYCSSRVGNDLTVTYRKYGGFSTYDGGATFTSRLAGSQAGSGGPTWRRVFSALSGADNGKGVNDPAASGAVPVRSRKPDNPYYVPQRPALFGYGYYGHSDYLTDPRFNPWTPSAQKGGASYDDVARSGCWDGTEFYLQYRLWFDTINADPVGGGGGKVMMLQTETTVPQQLTTFVGYGGMSFWTPGTPEFPFVIAKYSTSGGSASMYVTEDPLDRWPPTSYQPNSYDPVTGKSWAETAKTISGLGASGYDTPDSAPSFEVPFGVWVTYLIHMRPGRIWHDRVDIIDWNPVTETSINLIAQPVEWGTTNFEITVSWCKPDFQWVNSVYNVASLSGDVMSGVTHLRGEVVAPPFLGGRDVLAGNNSYISVAGAPRGVSNSTMLDVKIALPGRGYFTVLHVDDYPLQYGSRGQYANVFDDSLPGYNAICMTGYHNLELSGAVLPKKTWYQKIGEVIFSRDFIPAPDDTPSWVPAAGSVAAHTSGGPVLDNTFRSQVASYYTTFYSVKIVNDFSTAVPNSYLGEMGGLVIHGGGHAGTNNNQTIGLVFSRDKMKFVNLNDPTNWHPENPGLNDLGDMAIDADWLDALPSVDSQPRPLSPHNYAYPVVIPPTRGGAAMGSYFVFAVGAGGAAGFTTGGGAHTLDIVSATDQAANAWSRTGAKSLQAGVLGGPAFAEYVVQQQRTYYKSRGTNGARVSWFDHKTKTYEVGTGIGFDDSGDDASGRFVYVKERALLLCLTRIGGSAAGTLRIQYMNVPASAYAVDQPTVDGTATLSVQLPLAGITWAHAFWCPNNNRLIIGKCMFNGATDNEAVYEITIPDALSSAWMVTRAPFGNGTTIPWSDTWQNFCFFPEHRAAVLFPTATPNDTDTVYVYRPRNT